MRHRIATGSLALAGAVLCGLASGAPGAAAPPRGPFDDAVRPFLSRHCFDCHGEDVQKRGLRLDTLDRDLRNAATFDTWVKVHDMIRSGEMPPKKKKRPPEADRKAALASLERALREADLDRRRTDGRTVLRRLNRTEYENALRDLLARPHLRVRHMLPEDNEADGFDTVGEALRISYVHMNRYLETAKAALDEAAWLAPAPARYTCRIPFIEIHRFRSTFDRTTVGDEAVILRQPNTAQTPWRIDSVQIPFPGTHRIRIRARAATYRQDRAVPEDDNRAPKGVGKKRNPHGRLGPPERPQIVSVYQGTRLLGSIRLDGRPSTGEIVAHLYAGRSARESDDHRLILHVPTMSDWNPKWKKGPYTGPAVALDWIEVEGPLENDYPVPSTRALFGDLPVVKWTEDSGVLPPPVIGELKHPKRYPKIELPPRSDRYMVASKDPERDARRLLETFLGRAFRRPVPASETERYLAIVRDQLRKKRPFHTALLEGYRAALCSPDFLFTTERPGPLDGPALAARLAAFLWKSIPDDRLRGLAGTGELAKPAVLRAQVERMLGDPRAGRFVEDFTAQWLDLSEINFTQPDRKLYPEYDDFLKESMVAETHATFRKMLREDLPARTAIDADFAIVNGRLAEVYGLEGVEGVELREVALPEGSPRGGFLTQASVLKVTANGTTTSPVVRGAWVLERLLGTPPPPPPPDVPAIEPDTRGTSTIRERLAKHREDPACAGCHSKIDPPGFALESFDVIGGWRERYRSEGEGEKTVLRVRGQPVAYRLGPEVDPSGKTAEGDAFADIHGFKKLLLARERQVARNLVERLAVYATGAKPTFADREVVEAILDGAKGGAYGLRTILHGVVASRLFREK